MTPYKKEVLYTIRNAEGMITDVFDTKLNKYLKVVDTVIRIDSEKPEDMKLVKGGS